MYGGTNDVDRVIPIPRCLVNAPQWAPPSPFMHRPLSGVPVRGQRPSSSFVGRARASHGGGPGRRFSMVSAVLTDDKSRLFD